MRSPASVLLDARAKRPLPKALKPPAAFLWRRLYSSLLCESGISEIRNDQVWELRLCSFSHRNTSWTLHSSTGLFVSLLARLRCCVWTFCLSMVGTLRWLGPCCDSVGVYLWQQILCAALCTHLGPRRKQEMNFTKPLRGLCKISTAWPSVFSSFQPCLSFFQLPRDEHVHSRSLHYRNR